MGLARCHGANCLAIRSITARRWRPLPHRPKPLCLAISAIWGCAWRPILPSCVIRTAPPSPGSSDCITTSGQCTRCCKRKLFCTPRWELNSQKKEQIMEQQEKKTYRVKPGRVWAHLKEGETVELTEAEAAPYPEDLEEGPDEAAPKKPAATPKKPA